MKKHRFARMPRIALALTLCGCPLATMGQPVMSHGQQVLNITYSECLNRASQGLRNVGFVNIGVSGRTANGFKDASGAYIICNEVSGNATVINIVVATIGNDAGIPGLLRQQLQAQMERLSAASPPVGGTQYWVRSGEGDCSGHDVAETNGPAPDPTKLNVATIAVCWDGNRYNNTFRRSGEAWCTYKSISSCSGGGNPGMLYRRTP